MTAANASDGPGQMVSHGPDAPHHVRLPVMRHRWDSIAFLHWSYPVATVQRLLPPGLTVQPRAGKAWVGLVPFQMRVRPPFGPTPPRVTTFPETNVRTYVIGPDGTPGIWFFSLDAANAPAVGAARILYGLPYFLARMAVERDHDTITYSSRRLHGRAAGAGHRIVLEAGADLRPEGLGEFDHFLTARFTLWTVHAGAFMRTPAEHPRWVLRRARVHTAQQELLEAGGLPGPSGAALAHFSDGVDVRIGPPSILRRSGA